MAYAKHMTHDIEASNAAFEPLRLMEENPT